MTVEDLHFFINQKADKGIALIKKYVYIYSSQRLLYSNFGIFETAPTTAASVLRNCSGLLKAIVYK